MTSSGPAGGEGLEEARDLGRVMLAVGVQGDDRGGPGIQGVAEAGAQGRALARVWDLAQDRGTGRLGRIGRVVGRPVIDHDDRQVGDRSGHDRTDPRALLVGRDEREDLVGDRHAVQYRCPAGPSIGVFRTLSGTTRTVGGSGRHPDRRRDERRA